VFISRPETPKAITATYAWKDRVFAAWGGNSRIGVWIFKRGKKIHELDVPSGLSEPIQSLKIFGSWIIGCCSSRIEVWKSANYEHYTTIYPSSTLGGQLSGVLCTMPTLLNKILIGKQDGSVEIWNISVGKLIYTISPPSVDTGPVTALEPSPALDLLAIARADGSLVIHDVRKDREVLKLNTSSLHKSITSISFRTDGLGAGEDGREDGVMVAASIDSSDVTVWDLNDGGRIMGVLRNAHYPPPTNDTGVDGGITKVEFLAGQPVIVTSGLDNSLKSWIFDENVHSAVPRILHSRSGHAAQITRLEFLPVEADGSDAIGKWLLSASRDRSLWGWSLRRDGQSTELSQGNIQKKAKTIGFGLDTIDREPRVGLEDLKAPEITCMACCLNRDGGMGASTGGGNVWANVTNKSKPEADNGPSGWESIITGHRGDKFARTWFWGRKKAGRWAFETKDGTEVKVGYSTLSK
jgi:U3 small nucleolar RNA-associated protein 21